MYGYETVAASQTDQIMGDASAANNIGGQKLHRMISRAGPWKVTTGAGCTAIAVGIFNS